MSNYQSFNDSYRTVSHSVDRSLHNMVKTRYVDNRPTIRPRPTPQPRNNFNSAIPDKTVRTDLQIREGNLGQKFLRINDAINEIQSDLRCPFSQYYDASVNKCRDLEVSCPNTQYYDSTDNKCIDNGLVKATTYGGSIAYVPYNLSSDENLIVYDPVTGSKIKRNIVMSGNPENPPMIVYVIINPDVPSGLPPTQTPLVKVYRQEDDINGLVTKVEFNDSVQFGDINANSIKDRLIIYTNRLDERKSIESVGDYPPKVYFV